MRVIAGKYKGRRLQAPRGRDIRPTSDRLRESIFNIIGAAVAGHNIVDIFAGTGAMGIEALSRGAAHAVFIDKHHQALDVVRTNVNPLETSSRHWDIIRWDAGLNLSCLAALDLSFGVAFIDPPYNKGYADRALENLATSNAMVPGGLVVLEHHHLEGISLRDKGMSLQDQRRYGKTLVTFLRIMV